MSAKFEIVAVCVVGDDFAAEVASSPDRLHAHEVTTVRSGRTEAPVGTHVTVVQCAVTKRKIEKEEVSTCVCVCVCVCVCGFTAHQKPLPHSGSPGQRGGLPGTQPS